VVGVHKDPDVAHNQRRYEYLVVWERWVPRPGIHDTYALRVTGDGTLIYPESAVLRRNGFTRADAICPAL